MWTCYLLNTMINLQRLLFLIFVKVVRIIVVINFGSLSKKKKNKVAADKWKQEGYSITRLSFKYFLWRLWSFRRPWAPGRILNYLFGGYPTYFPVNFRSLANYHFFREFSIFEGNEWKRKKVSHLNIPKEISLPARWRQITAVKLLTVTQSNLSGWNVTQLRFKDLPLFGVQAWSQRLVTFDWWQIVITRKVVGIRGVSIFFAIFETPLKPKAWFWYACGDVFLIQVLHQLIWKDGVKNYIDMTSTFLPPCRYVLFVVHLFQKRTSVFM